MSILMVKGSSHHAAREVILEKASGFLTGNSTVVAYLNYLQEEGVNFKEVVVCSCQKRHFLFDRGKVLQGN